MTKNLMRSDSRYTIQRRFFIFSFILVAILGILPYLVYAVVYPDLSLEGLLIYRRDGDFTYLPQVRALADLKFGEAILKEHVGQGIRSFPFAALVLHALCFRLFGTVGLILADSITYLLYHSILISFLRVMRMKRFTAAILSLAIIFLLPFHYHLHMIFPKALLFIFWGFRFPRPFVTEIFLLSSITVILSLFSDPNIYRMRWKWILLVVALAFFVQADIYPAITVLILIGILLPMILLSKKDSRAQFLGFTPILVITGVICLLPFIIQRVLEVPDIPRRFGVFNVSRLEPQLLEGVYPRMIFLVGFGLGLLVVLRFSKAAHQEVSSYTILILIMLGICSFLAQPISIILLGKTIQPYHFALQFDTVTSYSLLGLFIIALKQVVHLRPFRSIYPSPVTVTVLLGLMLGVEGLMYIKMFPALSRKHIRPDFQAYNRLPNYRQNFTLLLHELNRPKYKEYNVLATLDIQVFVWWTTFKAGHGFLTDPFNSALSDEVVENRLIRFCKLCGMNSPEQFSKFVQQRYINMWWLGHNKYQASKAYTYGPLEQYPEEIQEQIHEEPWGVWYGCWRLHIPEGEIVRLQRKFKEHSDPIHAAPLPNIIILTRHEIQWGFEPLSVFFVQRYANEAFVVYTRQETQPEKAGK